MKSKTGRKSWAKEPVKFSFESFVRSQLSSGECIDTIDLAKRVATTTAGRRFVMHAGRPLLTSGGRLVWNGVAWEDAR